QRTTEKPPLYRQNGESVVLIEANLDKADQRDYKEVNAQVQKLVNESQNELHEQRTSIQMLDPKEELNEALEQLLMALGMSLLLIFMSLVLQFRYVVSPLIVMLALPLGMIGVFISLYVFNSTLSLNSALGMILLGGIAVNNSILLVEFINRLFAQGASA